MDTPRGARVTLAQVAAEAGVSLPTVSKVVNGKADVAAATRARVEAVLERHSYRRPAQSPAESPLVELVFHELDSAWSMELIKGVENVASAHGASVVLSQTGTRHSPEPAWVDGMLRRRPLGVVLVFSTLSADIKRKLHSRSIPFVVIDPAGDPEPDVPSVGAANWSGGLAATRHLIEGGHRRIAIITGPEDMLCSLARLAGYRSAMQMAGLEVPDEYVRFGDFHVDGGQREAKELLNLDEPPTAIFAGSDLQALGVVEGARTAGLQVPRDLSVVGYDDIPLSRWASPALTTVHQPLQQMAEEAVRMLLRLREGDQANTRLELATSLVVRQSTGAPPATARGGRRRRD